MQNSVQNASAKFYSATGSVPVPHVRLAGYPASLSAHGGGSAAECGLNKVWECYVAGIDPEDKNARFEAVIDMVDGKPVVKWNPPL